MENKHNLLKLKSCQLKFYSGMNPVLFFASEIRLSVNNTRWNLKLHLKLYELLDYRKVKEFSNNFHE